MEGVLEGGGVYAPLAPGYVFPEQRPKLSREEAQERVGDFDITIPEDGIREVELNILLRRHREQRERQLILSRATPWQQVGAFGAGLAASFIDPLNIASAFIPVVGPGRYARMVERAAGPLERAMVRARVGAAEGAVGAAVVEPLPLLAAAQDQTDYGMADSLLNIAFGSIIGGGLHVSAGLFGGEIRRPVRDIEPPREDAPLSRSFDSRLDRPDIRHALKLLREELPSDSGARLDPSQDDVITAIRKVGGADREELIAEGFDPADLQRLPPGTVRSEGRRLDDLRETLAQDGYPGDLDQFIAAIDDTLKGSPVFSASRILPPREIEGIRARPSDIGRAIEKALDGGKLSPAQRGIVTDLLQAFDEDFAYPGSASAQIRSADFSTQQDAFRGAIAQAATGRPIDVEPVFNRAMPEEPVIQQSPASIRADEEVSAISDDIAEIEAQIEAEMELAGDVDLKDVDAGLEEAEAYGRALKTAAVCMRSG